MAARIKSLRVNSQPTAQKKKRGRGKPFTGRDDPRTNLKGAPKRGESWTEIIKRYGEMTPSEAAQESLELTKKLLSIGDGVTLKQAVVLRVYAALLFEPQPGLLNAFLERAEGAVTRKLEHTGVDGGPIQFAQLSDAELDAWLLAQAEKVGLTPDERQLLENLFAKLGAGRISVGPGGEGAAGGGAA